MLKMKRNSTKHTEIVSMNDVDKNTGTMLRNSEEGKIVVHAHRVDSYFVPLSELRLFIILVNNCSNNACYLYPDYKALSNCCR